MKNPNELLCTHISTLCTLWRGNNNKSPLKKEEIDALSKNLFSLQRGLTGTRHLVGSSYMENKELLGAYLLYYWPVSYMQSQYAICSSSYPLNLWKTKHSVRILDIGSGPAPVSTALCDIILTHTKAQPSVTILDSSQKALSLAQKLFKKDFPTVPINAICTNIEQNELVTQEVQSESYDCITISHCLNELWQTAPLPEDNKVQFITDLCTLLSPNGVLLLTEPALLSTSRALIAIRDRLAQLGLTILSPCLTPNKCPALSEGENHTCHAEIFWNPPSPICELAQNAGLKRISFKMTFFLFAKSPLPPKNKNTKQKYRVVSDAMLNKAGRVRYLLCNGASRIPLSAKKDDENAQKQGFFKLRRYDIISIEDAEMRGTREAPALGIKNSTKIHKF